MKNHDVYLNFATLYLLVASLTVLIILVIFSGLASAFVAFISGVVFAITGMALLADKMKRNEER